MATYTPNNNLKKPSGTDYVQVADLNQNMDIVDGFTGDLAQLNTPSKQSLVAAINDAATMGGGNPPYFEESTLTWWEWDFNTAQYVDTGRPASASIEVESTVTLAPGEDAEVENIGDGLDVMLRFSIPQGAPGEAATITAGVTNTLGPDQPAEVTSRGTAQDRILDFSIPRGETGAGLAIKGHFETLADLQTAHAAGDPGDMYSVGTSDPYDFYIWDEATNTWFDEGPMSGGGGTVTSWNDVPPNEEGNVAVDAGNLPFDSSASTVLSTKETIATLQTEQGELQAELNDFESQKGAANGLATLGGTSKVPVAQLPSSSTSTSGIVQLSSATDSTSATQAATPSSVKTAYDLAVSKAISVSTAVTLPASGWSVNGTYTVSYSQITATSNGDLYIAQSATAEQFDAWAAAQIQVTGQAAGSITLTARGEVPAVDVPIEVEVRK